MEEGCSEGVGWTKKIRDAKRRRRGDGTGRGEDEARRNDQVEEEKSGWPRDRRRYKSPGTRAAREENKGKARKMCLTWQRQFFSQSCRLNARWRKAIGSGEEPVGKMAAISLQPPVQVSSLLHLLICSLFLFRCPWRRPTERNPVRGIKGEKHAPRLLFLLTV